MTIDFHIIVGKSLDAVDIKKINYLINSTFQEIDSIYNKWNPYSEISRINRHKAGEKIVLSPSLERFLLQTDAIVQLTERRFDPTIEPLQQLWKSRLQTGKKPTNDEIEAIVAAVGWHHIHFGEGFIEKDHDLTAIDLGGVAKGLCVDLLVERLSEQGYLNHYVEWGGEIRCSGKHPELRNWTIFISRLGNPNPSQAIATLPLIDSALATSGDYLQNWTSETDGVVFFHIFDPKTFQPLISSRNSIASTSVKAPTCALADGLATAAMMFATVKEAEEWALSVQDKLPETEFWIISRS